MSDFLLSVDVCAGTLRLEVEGPCVSRHANLEGGATGAFAGDLVPRDGRVLAPEEALAAVARGDQTVLARLHGGYAFATWHPGTRTLTLLRDAVGRWSLYHAVSSTTPTTIVAGTSATAVARAAGLLDGVDPDAADEFWAEGFVRPTRTIFQGVTPLPLGELTRFWPRADDVPGINRAATPARPAGGPRCDDEDPGAVRKTLGGLFEAAMERVLADRALRPTTLTLSGGIDSTLVAVFAARLGVKPRAVTLGALVPGTQDELWARFAAHRTGLTVSVVRPHLQPLVPLIARSATSPDQPFWVKSLAMYQALAETAEAGGVLLTGDCADGVFLGGTDARKWTQDLSPARPSVAFGPPLPPWLGSTGRDQATNHAVGHLLARQLHVTRALGVLARSPFIDWDIMSFARSLPRHLLLEPGRTKAVLQDQLSGWPALFLNRPKLGFPFRLRWAVAARMELDAVAAGVSERAIERFRARLPARLQTAPRDWRRADVFRHFDDVLKLLSWSAFKRQAVA